MRRTASVWLVLVGASGCVGTTGGDIIDFDAAAAGPPDAKSGEALSFQSDRGWDVTLTKATLHVGAIYLGESIPVSGAQNTSCILPGTYVAEVTTGLDVDLLSPRPQRFPKQGHGTTLEARAGQVWLTHGDVNQVADSSADPILDIEGTATLGGDVRAFIGKFTISTNRQDANPDFPGANPICKERIVSPIATSVVLEPNGGLLLRIDPRLLFVGVDLGQLDQVSGTYVFSDGPKAVDSQPSAVLYSRLHSGTRRVGASLYTFSWDPHL